MLDANTDISWRPLAEWNVSEWEPPTWRARGPQVIHSVSDLPQWLESAVVVRFDADKDPDEQASTLRDYLHYVDVARPAIVTGFGLDQPSAVTAEGIERELTSAAGQHFRMQLDKDLRAYEISSLGSGAGPGSVTIGESGGEPPDPGRPEPGS